MNTKIQLITSEEHKFGQWKLQTSNFDQVQALDAFDLNIIDLSGKWIWKNKANHTKSVNMMNDFTSLKRCIQNSITSNILYILPENVNFSYYYNSNKQSYYYAVSIKDILEDLYEYILPKILIFNIRDTLICETSNTIVNGECFTSSFSFLPEEISSINATVLTSAEGSKKPTTILKDRFYITTLQLTGNEENLYKFLEGIHLLKHDSVSYPEWLSAYEILDDSEQKAHISQYDATIQQAEQAKTQAQQKLQENLKYKSILIESGDNLVETVFRLLEEILAVDLSGFIDQKNEDFLFPCGNTTFIGEIKGVSTNVKSEHVSQVDRHFQAYQDQLQEEGCHETVKQLLIINPFRNKPLDQRDPVHENQINLAKRNDCLIILTETLLTIFERFRNHQVTTSDIKKAFAEKTGLLSTDDIPHQKQTIVK